MTGSAKPSCKEKMYATLPRYDYRKATIKFSGTLSYVTPFSALAGTITVTGVATN